jgi:hypothetical protein
MLHVCLQEDLEAIGALEQARQGLRELEAQVAAAAAAREQLAEERCALMLSALTTINAELSQASLGLVWRFHAHHRRVGK